MKKFLAIVFVALLLITGGIVGLYLRSRPEPQFTVEQLRTDLQAIAQDSDNPPSYSDINDLAPFPEFVHSEGSRVVDYSFESSHRPERNSGSYKSSLEIEVEPRNAENAYEMLKNNFLDSGWTLTTDETKSYEKYKENANQIILEKDEGYASTSTIILSMKTGTTPPAVSTISISYFVIDTERDIFHYRWDAVFDEGLELAPADAQPVSASGGFNALFDKDPEIAISYSSSKNLDQVRLEVTKLVTAKGYTIETPFEKDSDQDGQPDDFLRMTKEGSPEIFYSIHQTDPTNETTIRITSRYKNG